MPTRNFVAACICLVAAGTACKDKEVATTTPPPPSKPGAPTVEPPAELGREMPSAQGPTRPPPALWLQPTDLMTSTGETPIRILLDNSGAPVDSALLDTVAAAAELRTYPGLAPVSVTSKTFNPAPITTPADTPTKGGAPSAPTGSGTNQPAYVELTPTAALKDSWYVLSLKSIPAGVRTAPWSAPTPPVGAYAVRFHTGSHPVLSRVLLCRKAPGVHRAVFEFSENVQATSVAVDLAARVEQPGAGKACAYANSGPLAASSMRWLDANCTGFAEAAPWRISLAPGLTAPGGEPVRTFNGDVTLQQDVDWATLVDGDNGCKVWRP